MTYTTSSLGDLRPELVPMAQRAIREGNEIRSAMGDTLVIAEKRNVPGATLALAVILAICTAGIALLVMALLGAFRQHVELVEYTYRDGKMRRHSLKREPLR